MDVTKCPLEVFSFINQFASNHRITLILLHVVNVSVTLEENSVGDALSCLAGQHLKQLAERFVAPCLAVA
jgi:hypothetical protein